MAEVSVDDEFDKTIPTVAITPPAEQLFEVLRDFANLSFPVGVFIAEESEDFDLLLRGDNNASSLFFDDSPAVSIPLTLETVNTVASSTDLLNVLRSNSFAAKPPKVTTSSPILILLFTSLGTPLELNPSTIGL
mmetsp:Transcript_5907/g.12518  ORF Transcript_5907/g.12518 Transcript_5907/m.12518 type:complete len:134 (+) Transcript_5907:4867-5268(+)